MIPEKAREALNLALTNELDAYLTRLFGARQSFVLIFHGPPAGAEPPDAWVVGNYPLAQMPHTLRTVAGHYEEGDYTGGKVEVGNA